MMHLKLSSVGGVGEGVGVGYMGVGHRCGEAALFLSC